MYDIVNIFDFDFISAKDYYDFIDEVVNYKVHLQESKKLPFLITPNIVQLNGFQEQENQALKATLTDALFILPDGQSIILFSRLVRKPLKARLTGSDLLPILWNIVKQKNKRLFAIIANDNIGLKLQEEYDNVTYYSPPFFDPRKDKVILDQVVTDCFETIKNLNPEYIIIGIGFPKQELIGLAIHAKLVEQHHPSPLFLCLGASFEFYLNIKKRAPKWMQKAGLESLHRLLQEPRRMWRRYLFGAFRLALLWARQFFKEF
nr:WecB/TagA/CpsF family glycosyltransferase [Candidatus Parabeggiatoa sp.]